MKVRARFGGRPGFPVCRACGGTGVAPIPIDHSDDDYIERLEKRARQMFDRMAHERQDEDYAARLQASGWTVIAPTSPETSPENHDQRSPLVTDRTRLNPI